MSASAAESARRLVARLRARAERRPFVRAMLSALEREQASGAGLLAGGLAYRFFLWLVPAGLLVAALASFWVRESPASLEHTARDFGLGGVAAHSAADAVEEGSHARWYLLAFGLVLLVWAGAIAVRALLVAAFIAWRLPPERLRRPLTRSATFSGLAAAGLAASVWASWARQNTGGFGVLATLADVIVYTLVALFAFDHLPRPPGVGRSDLWPGALLVGCGITAVHLFTAYYLAGRLERSPELYGTLGAATVVLLILFLIARLLISAMFLNATLYERAREDARR